MSERLVLGIETVTRIGSLAVVREGEVLGQAIIDTQLRHTANLISSLDKLLHAINISISSIDTIAVDIGPGSFTGIRVGLSSAMGLSQLGKRQLIGICSLEVLCRKVTVPEGVKFLVPVIDAKRGLLYSAAYGIDGSEIKKPYLTTVENLPQGFQFGPEIDNTYPDACTVARIAGERIKDSKAEKNIEPLYIHSIEYKSS